MMGGTPRAMDANIVWCASCFAELPRLPEGLGVVSGGVGAGCAGQLGAAPVPEADPAGVHAAPVAPPAQAVLQQPVVLLRVRAWRWVRTPQPRACSDASTMSVMAMLGVDVADPVQATSS